MSGTRNDIVHADEDTGYVYTHVQRLTLAEWTTTAARGVAPGLGVELAVPIRFVRDRIRYERLDGTLYVPTDPELHHRNETRVGPGDPRLMLHAATRRGEWDLALRAGASLPVGTTEPNPFAAGRNLISHQHVQFGTGTVDPLVNVTTARPLGGARLVADAHARLVLYENRHGYRAGHRFTVGSELEGPLGAGFAGRTGLQLAREEAETWNGVLETEGNLGRTDLLLALGVSRALGAAGTIGLVGQISLWNRSTGDQVEQPLVLGVSWSR